MTEIAFRPYAKPNRAIRQAQVLSDRQVDRLMKFARRGPNAQRDVIAIMLSFYSALRAGEIAGLRWRENLCDAEGHVRSYITITGDIGKNSIARTINLPPKLHDALRAFMAHNIAVYGKDRAPLYVFHPAVVHSKFDKLTPSAVSQWFRRLYADAGFEGCSSHSGRRTFITNNARQAGLDGCSLKDVQQIAGHRHLETTAAYIQPSPNQAAMINRNAGDRPPVMEAVAA